MNKQLGEEFFSLATQKKKGSIVYIKKELEPGLIFNDSEGRFVAVEMLVNQKRALLVSMYAPNSAKEDFLKKPYLSI